MQTDGVDGDRLAILGKRQTGRGQARVQLGAGEAVGDADEDRRADGAEGDGRALDHQAEHHGGHGRKAQRHHQRCGDGGRGAEAGGALDERAEQPGDDDRLNTPIIADPVEAAADRRDPARVLERLEQKDRGEDDEQDIEGDEQALDGGGRYVPGVHAPHRPRQRHGRDVDQRHRPAGRDAEADEQQAGEQDRRHRHGRLKAQAHEPRVSPVGGSSDRSMSS